jgi:hypothetical protein
MHAAEISALQKHHILCDNGSFSPFLLMNSSMILHAIHQQSTPTSTMPWNAPQNWPFHIGMGQNFWYQWTLKTGQFYYQSINFLG